MFRTHCGNDLGPIWTLGSFVFNLELMEFKTDIIEKIDIKGENKRKKRKLL